MRGSLLAPSTVAARWPRMLLGLLCLLALLSQPCLGLIEHLRVADDARAAFHLGSFGYTAGGVFKLDVRDFKLGGAPVKDVYEVAFVVQRSSSDAPMRLSSSASTTDPTSEHNLIAKVTTPTPGADGPAPDATVAMAPFPVLAECFHLAQHGDDDTIIRIEAWREQLTYEHTITTAGFYHLYFSNCEPRTSATWEMDLTEYNVDGEGAPMYLSAGERYMPSILFVLALLFGCEMVAWGSYLISQRAFVKHIHLLMLVCVLAKTLSLSCESLKYHSLKAHGVHDGWVIFSYVVSIVKSMLLFVLIVLLATGYSYIKAFLVSRDRIILGAVVAVQALVSIATVVVGELQQGDSYWVAAHDTLVILDMACWCLVLVPIAWSLRALREAASDDQQKEGAASASAARSMHRLQAFRSFYVLVITFIYLTRLVVFLLNLTLPFELMWISAVFGETAALAFYANTGFLFRPLSANPYQALEEGDDEVEMQGLHDEHEDELDEAADEPHTGQEDATTSV